MSLLNKYIDHLYDKYESQMTDFERDCIRNRCGLSEIDHLTTDTEKEHLAYLFNASLPYWHGEEEV